MKRKAKLKDIPAFQNEGDERKFWHTHDSTDFIDYSRPNRVSIEFDPEVEKPVKLISIRLPREMLSQIKVMATKRDVPYQSLIKMMLAEKITEESSDTCRS